MINRIIDFSVNNRPLVIALVALAAIAGWWSMKRVSLDAIPDLGDTQVIIYSRWDRSPDIIEDQVTYPIVTAMVGSPRVRAVRGFSDFGYSFVYVIFEDGTDIYWARSRTLEYLSSVLPRLPAGVKTELGPDATGLGWVFQYALVDTTGKRSLAEMRSFQDWYLRYYLKAVPGVAEVAPIGGENVTTTVEGRERYPVNVRYMRDFRTDFGALERILIPVGDGRRQVPLSHLATIREVAGPSMIRDEDGMLTGYVYVDIAGRDVSSYIEEGSRLLREKLKLPPGYAVTWSGQYEAMQRVKDRLTVVLPLTLFLIFLLLYMNTRSVTKTFIVLLAVPFSAIGAIWLLYFLGYNMSIGVWVGLIALLGVDAETGVFMLLYLDLAYQQAMKEGRLRNLADLQQAILDGAVTRLRPKFMTVATLAIGLIPIMWATGTGSDVMKRIAAPMIGGIFTSFILELLVYPAIYQIWKWNFDLKKTLMGRGRR